MRVIFLRIPSCTQTLWIWICKSLHTQPCTYTNTPGPRGAQLSWCPIRPISAELRARPGSVHWHVSNYQTFFPAERRLLRGPVPHDSNLHRRYVSLSCLILGNYKSSFGLFQPAGPTRWWSGFLAGHQHFIYESPGAVVSQHKRGARGPGTTATDQKCTSMLQ